MDSVLNPDRPWQTAIHSVMCCAHCATHCVSTAVPGSLVLSVLVYVCAVCSMCVLYVGVQVYVSVHSVVWMVCSGYFGNLFGMDTK